MRAFSESSDCAKSAILRDIARYCAILRDIRRYSAIIHDIQKISARAGIVAGRPGYVAACWGVVFVCVVYSLSTQCIVSEQRTIKTKENLEALGALPLL